MAEDAKVSRPQSVHPFWSGTVTFGMVSIPVELYPARRGHGPSTRSVGADGRPLSRRYICPEHDEPLSSDQIVRGVPTGDAGWVEVTDAELEALEPKRSREIDLQRFVPLSAIDPMHFDRPYLLLPRDEVTKPYRLLAQTLRDSSRVGIGSFVMRGREYLVAILATDGLLRAETLRHADEVRSAEDVGLPALPEPEAERVAALGEAIAALRAETLDEQLLVDRDAAALQQLAEQRAAEGEQVITLPETEVEQTADEGEVVDIVEVLRQRLERASAA